MAAGTGGTLIRREQLAMNDLKTRMSRRFGRFPGRQRGAMTMFSAVLILVLLTELVLYATQVGVFEQRKSANDLRQKQAFHAAEAGLQNAKEFFLANVQFLSYPDAGGWLNGDSLRWQPCTAELAGTATHPCSGETFPRGAAEWGSILGGTYFYEFADLTNPQEDDTLLPIDTTADPDTDPDLLDRLEPLGERVEVQALLCVLDIDRTRDPEDGPVVNGCIPHGNVVPGDHIYFMLTLLAKGHGACADLDNPESCEAEALIAEKLGSFGPAAGNGGPGVPLTARSSFPPGGNPEVVPNPNGGGPGVPISAWINGNVGGDCPGPVNPYESFGSWSSCERHEFYQTDILPEDFLCDRGAVGGCSCDPDERRLSYNVGGVPVVGIDIVIDDNFPCDLFKSTFGVEKTIEEFNALKASIGVEIDDCGILDETSAGVYWFTDDKCEITGGATVGSPEFPVFLVSAAATETKLAGGVNFYGLIFITDLLAKEDDPLAEPIFKAVGTNTVYGAIVADIEAAIQYGGDFELVYIDSIINLVSQSGGIGKVTGGWTDFHPVWRGRLDEAPPGEEG
jgi:hypothetical protein